jgi:hypothetical protein
MHVNDEGQDKHDRYVHSLTAIVPVMFILSFIIDVHSLTLLLYRSCLSCPSSLTAIVPVINDEGQDKHDRYNSRVNECTSMMKDKINMTGTINILYSVFLSSIQLSTCIH